MDNQATNERCPNCHGATRVHVTLPVGGGRVFCANGCGWNDGTPHATPPTAGETPRQPVRPGGVEIHSVHGIGQKEGVEIVGGSR